MVHEGGFGLKRDPHGRLRFTRPDGQPIPDAPPGAASAHDIRELNRRRGLQIGPHTTVPLWAGERMDYGLAVDAMLCLDGAPRSSSE